jgi:PmbA protein
MMQQNLSQHTNRADVKSTRELTDLMQSVLHEARQQGASDAAVSVNHDHGFSVNVRMNDVESLAFSEEMGMSVTVFHGKQKGSASSSDTSPAALKAMVIAASEIAKVSAADPCFGLPDAQLLQLDYPDLDLYHPWDVSPAEAIERAQRCEAEALQSDKRISNSDGVSFSTYNFCLGYATTQGFNGIVKSSRHSVSVSLIATEDDKMQRDYDYTTARHSTALMPLDILAKSAVERTVGRLGAQQIKTQSCPVLFSSRLSSGLFSSFIQAISGSNLYRKNSFLLDSVGEVLFPQNIQVYEQPHLLRGLGSSPFDAEGVITRPNVFVKDGVLCQYALGSYSARKMGLATTANSGGVSNLTIDPTDNDLNDLLKKMGTGLLVTELMGQGVNIMTGDYSRGASGFWVEQGVIKFPVEEITIAGNLKDMFKSIIAVGRDINPNSATRCGSVLIESMTIAGQNS